MNPLTQLFPALVVWEAHRPVGDPRRLLEDELFEAAQWDAAARGVMEAAGEGPLPARFWWLWERARAIEAAALDHLEGAPC